MPIDWELKYELNEVWHSSFWEFFALWQGKHWVCMAENKDSHLAKNSLIFRVLQHCDPNVIMYENLSSY